MGGVGSQDAFAFAANYGRDVSTDFWASYGRGVTTDFSAFQRGHDTVVGRTPLDNFAVDLADAGRAPQSGPDVIDGGALHHCWLS